jgi:predicted CXXCH cytochrome family protein
MREHLPPLRQAAAPLASGLGVGLLALLLSVGQATAQPAAQQPSPTPAPRDCSLCHLDIADHWSSSPHAHAFDDETFQQWWQGAGQPGECLACHTTGYLASSRTYQGEGVTCEGCHGEALPDHPPAIIPVRADTEYCGVCHTTTLGEWRQTGHAMEDVGCSDCHDPHSQKALFPVADDLCINCHREDMGDYLEDLHVQKGIGCVDCHALVIPPETAPEDGIVPTGHTFTISPATCVACHTDALHAGFALPGYENGAVAAGEVSAAPDAPAASLLASVESGLSPEQRLQALETSVASRSLTSLMQGGIVGLVLGGSTAWLVARNARRGHPEEPHEEGS